MSNVSTKKVFIQIESAAEQQEHIRNQRKTLKVLQGVVTDKENLTGRPQIDKLSRLKAAADATTLASSTEFAKRKKVETRVAETQTSPIKTQQALQLQNRAIIADDLTGDAAPSEYYWERLAEKRREALEDSLVENKNLYERNARLEERNAGLEEELNTSRQMLEEARNLVEVLTEMLNENEAEREIEGGTGEEQDQDQETDGTKAKSIEDEGSETRSSTAEQASTALDKES